MLALSDRASTNVSNLSGTGFVEIDTRATVTAWSTLPGGKAMELLAGLLLYILIGFGIEELAQRVERRYHHWRTGRDDYERPSWPDASIVFAWPLFVIVIIAARDRE